MLPPATEPQTAATDRPSIDLELSNPAFTGPLALLLELIEKRRLPITEVSLAEVADQYMERIKTIAGMDPELLAEFLVIAAKLLVIKSRELLPSAPPVEEEIDVAAELQRRLLEYRIFRDAAEQLRQLEEAGRNSYSRQPSDSEEPLPEPPLGPIPPEALRDAMVRMLKALRPEVRQVPNTPRVSVQDRITHLMDVLTSRGSAVFSELSGLTVAEIVATFLALLELLRRGQIMADQESAFGEIRMSLVPADGLGAG